MRGLVIFALIVVAVCTIATGSNIKDSIVLRVFNKNLQMSDSEMIALLKKANLENHGYKREVFTKYTRRPGDKKPDYVKTVYFYKLVPCKEAYNVEKELNRLLKGIVGAKVLRKVKEDLSSKNLDDPKRKCRAGVEIHFHKNQRCSSKGDRRKAKRCWWFFCGNKCNKCFICLAVTEV